MYQKKLPLEKTEYYSCLGLAMFLGKTLEQARVDWTNLNTRLTPDYKTLHKECEICKK